MKLLTSLQMQKIDREAIERLGIPSMVLMENAARALSEELARFYPSDAFPRLIAVAGKGNNGGDAIAVARILSGKGYRVSLALLAQPSDLKNDPAQQLKIYRGLGLPMATILSVPDWRLFLEERAVEPPRTVLLDGLFGVGLSRPLEAGFWGEMIDEINRFSGPVLSVDLPSGVMESETDSGKRVAADMTITLQEPKTALIKPWNRRAAGRIRVVDIGIPKPLYESNPELIRWIDRSMLDPLLGDSNPFAHKYDHGHGLALVGSERMPGAGVLAVKAALRSGIGLCTAMIPDDLGAFFVHSCPEAVLLHRRDEPDFQRFSAVLAGPGLGRDDSAVELLKRVLPRVRGALILDADALNTLAANGWDRSTWAADVQVILTPHSGEMARLLGRSRQQVESGRETAVKELARRFQGTVVLKGKYSLVATPDGRLFVNPTGNPGMACAGSGDVLSGMILGMVSRFGGAFPLEQIVCSAVWLHGRSGDLAADERGQLSLQAGDLIDFLPQALEKDDDGGIQI